MMNIYTGWHAKLSLLYMCWVLASCLFNSWVWTNRNNSGPKILRTLRYLLDQVSCCGLRSLFLSPIRKKRSVEAKSAYQANSPHFPYSLPCWFSSTNDGKMRLWLMVSKMSNQWDCQTLQLFSLLSFEFLAFNNPNAFKLLIFPCFDW